MVRAHHIIFSAYGFWLPNDPRGSWSDFVGAWELFRFGGPATRVYTANSLAAAPHDRQRRLATKQAMRYPPVVFDGYQALEIAGGFGTQAANCGYTIYACAILPEHVHMVIASHRYRAEYMISLLKRGATESMTTKGLHPLCAYPGKDGSLPTPWARKGWDVFLNDQDEIVRAIDYVDKNPMKEGKRPQNWGFVKRFTAPPT